MIRLELGPIGIVAGVVSEEGASVLLFAVRLGAVEARAARARGAWRSELWRGVEA